MARHDLRNSYSGRRRRTALGQSRRGGSGGDHADASIARSVDIDDLHAYVDILWLERKYPTIRRLKKLGMEVWVEPGGFIAARYIGSDPFADLPKSNWQQSSRWKHKFWFWRWRIQRHPEQEPEGSLFEWSSYMLDRIKSVLEIQSSLQIRWPTTAVTPHDLIFVVESERIQ